MGIKGFLIFCVAFLAYSSNKFLGDSMLNRPLVTASLTGLVLGDLQTGLIMAGTLELTWMGIMYLGLSMPSDVTAGSIIGTAYAILSHSDASIALSVSIPAGILAAYVSSSYNVIVTFLMPKVDKYAEEGNLKGIDRIHILIGVVKCAVTAGIVWLAVAIGSDAVGEIVDSLPQFILNGLNVASGALPALGFAMLLNIMWDKRFLPFYFIGFVLATYFDANIMAVTVIAASFAIYRFLTQNSQPNADEEEEAL
jgi:mannose/fructose/N-acetylgalactosamine-specific phosphotransferase system component IIC